MEHINYNGISAVEGLRVFTTIISNGGGAFRSSYKCDQEYTLEEGYILANDYFCGLGEYVE